MDPFIGPISYTMVSALSSLSQAQVTETYQCEARIGCVYTSGVSSTTIGMKGHSTAPTDSPKVTTILPLSIVPSDVMGSLAGSSIPTTLVMDTGSVDSPASTQWHSPSTTSPISTTRVSAMSALTVTRTRQSIDEETTVPVTTETLTYYPQPSPTATGVVTLSFPSESAGVSTPADSSGQSAVSSNSWKCIAMGGLNKLSIGILGLWGFVFITTWL